MTTKLKMLGLGPLAVMAVGAFAVVEASATTSGHFTSEAKEHHLIVKGTATSTGIHSTKFQRTVNGQPSGSGIECTHVNYHGTVTSGASTTTQEVSLRPEFIGCGTAGGTWGELVTHIPTGCGTNVLKFTSRTPPNHGTAHLECPITVTHPNCNITVPKQTPSGGVAYETSMESGVHAITANVTVTGITGHFEGGICIFLGTTHTYDMTGSVTLWSESTEGERVGITAT